MQLVKHLNRVWEWVNKEVASFVYVSPFGLSFQPLVTGVSFYLQIQ